MNMEEENKADLTHRIQDEFRKEIESIHINEDLLKKIKEENPKEFRILPIWFYSPSTSYAMGLLALIFATLFFLKPSKTNELIVYKESPAQIIKDTVVMNDTIYLEKRIPAMNQTRLVSNSSSKKRKIKPRTKPPVTFAFDEQYFDSQQLEEQQKAIGKSSDESGDLAQFLGVSI